MPRISSLSCLLLKFVPPPLKIEPWPSASDLSIIQAVEKDNIETLKHLLSMKGANVNLKHPWGYNLLMIAAELNNQKAFKVLIDYGIRVDTIDLEGNTLLFTVAKESKLHFMKELIIRGANVNYKNIDGLSLFDVISKNDNSTTESKIQALKCLTDYSFGLSRSQLEKASKLILELGNSIKDAAETISETTNCDENMMLGVANSHDEI